MEERRRGEIIIRQIKRKGRGMWREQDKVETVYITNDVMPNLILMVITPSYHTNYHHDQELVSRSLKCLQKLILR